MSILLMNKDIKVLEFCIDNISGISSVVVQNVFNNSLIPLPLRSGISLESWLNSRLVMDYRKDVSRLFNKLGVLNFSDRILCTHCISLLDTYWIKSSEDRLNWANVSPYRNPLNELVARYSFDEDIIGTKNVGCSPDFSTGGSYPKCWRKVNNQIYLYKAGSSGAVNSGNEPYSEVMASELAKYLGFTCVEYELVKYKGVIATRCLNMCSEDNGIYAVSEVYPKIATYEELFKLVRGTNSIMQLVQILLLDYLTLNIDRHFNNISFIVDNNNQRLLRVAPIYDNNMSLLPYYIEKFDISVENYLRCDRGYSFTKCGQSFDDLLKLLYTINSNYVIWVLRRAEKFRYSKSNRSDIANKILRIQIERAKEILNWR